ncbi:MAG: hypothetical protein A2782_03190 [Candidatus Blackburnbacteria bacterium RIFCSPHIGHO2_01_FULL_43_15b]|uniref:Uncharacterized protein n=1 Tax=Candidatus Blackburnbacteria bacterium RIFCSPHIGHO2_01_FULL_43_15b TaxID=1797513 RepID=A0A1G1V171_9BACT|nr:MAG: hypothetical protein A2782_03190 [Candidatus Blackburnbacteria bacterium RIFCSPHIGHO2_01_FULL_43_15b]
MSLDVLDDAALEHPAYLPAVHRIARQAVKFPTNNPLRLAALNAGEHFVKDRTAGNFGRLFFNKFFGDIQTFVFGYAPQNGKLVLNRPDLLVFNIGGFASVEKIVEHIFN